MPVEDKDPKVTLKRVRLSFADNLYAAERGDERASGKHKGKVPYRWSANFIIDGADKAQIEAVKVALRKARDAQWPSDPPKIKADKMCLRDGDEESYAGYAGNWYVSASRTAYGSKDGTAPKRPFRIIGRNKVKRDDGTPGFPDVAEGIVYAGCYVNVVIRIWAQDDAEYGKRLNASIEAVQFWEDGEALGGGAKVNVDEAFDEFGGEGAFDEGSGDEDDDLI